MKRLFFYPIIILFSFFLGADKAAMAVPAQKIFAQKWTTPDTGKIGADSIKWLQDLAFYREQMPKTHGNLFHTMTRQQFNDTITALEGRIARLTVNQAKTAILRLVAMVNDGHTRVRQETLGEHMLPIRLYYFSDGLYVEAAEKDYQNIIGGKVEKIGNMSEEQVYAAVRNLSSIDGDNEYRRRLMAPALMVNPEILQSIGSAGTCQSIKITVLRLNQHITVSLPAGEFHLPSKHGWSVDGPDWINARTLSGKPTPLWLQHSDKTYWSRFLPDGKTLYIQYNEVADQKGNEPVVKFFPSLIKEAEEKKVEQIVLDLRLNSGGDNGLNRPIWQALIKSERFNQKGKLWVIIGPKTFSAAMDLVDDLELNTNAIFIGQPTGETPNQWGDPRDIKLPNSGIVIQASTLWWQFQDPRDDRSCKMPDIMVGMSFNDYQNGIDPVMQVIDKR